MVESFASYFARLAYLHAISRSQLANVLITRHRNLKDDCRVTFAGPVYASSGTGLLGYQERMDVYIDMVQEASGQSNLDRSTLIPIRSALGSQCKGSIKNNRAWCDACFLEDMESFETPYDRFLWALTPIERCPVHRLKLREICPACGRAQRHHHRSGNPQLCMKCGVSLIGSASGRVPALKPGFGERDCVRLVGAIASGELTTCAPDAVRTFENEVAKAHPPLARALQEISEPSGLARAQGYLVRPTLRTLLSKSYASGVSVVDILQDPEGAAKAAGDLVLDRNEMPVETRVQHGDELLQEVRGELESHLTRSLTEKVPSLRALARSKGVSTSYIWRHFPRLAEKYQSHKRAAEAKNAWALRAACMDELERVLANPVERSRLARRKDLETYLVRRSGCTVRTARGVIFWKTQSEVERQRLLARGKGSKPGESFFLLWLERMSIHAGNLRRSTEPLSKGDES
ncbi:TniQ family protein [Pseudoxanthomonas wuyuanensis]